MTIPSMVSIPTFTATIYCGTYVRHGDYFHDVKEAYNICSNYCNEIGLCVSITETEFVYTNGFEPGIAVGFINYPRFPDDPYRIRDKAIELGKRLLDKMEQCRVSIVCSYPSVPSSRLNETIMLTNEDLVNGISR